MKPILISEVFGTKKSVSTGGLPTLQGEGKYTGVPSVFIRTSSCPSRCVWCDSAYTSWNAKGSLRDVESIYEEAIENKCKHIVITGGEPMIFIPQVAWLCNAFRNNGNIVTIETAGNIYDSSVRPDLWSVSPKLQSSTPNDEPERSMHLRSLKPENTPLFMAKDGSEVQYKFVVVNELDLIEVKMFKDKYNLPPDTIWLMPEGITREGILNKAGWVSEECKKNGFNLSIRLHAILWGAKRGV